MARSKPKTFLFKAIAWSSEVSPKPRSVSSPEVCNLVILSNLYPSKIGHLEVDLVPRRSRFSDSRPIGRIPVPIAEPRNIGVKACVWEEGRKIIRFFCCFSLSHNFERNGCEARERFLSLPIRRCEARKRFQYRRSEVHLNLRSGSSSEVYSNFFTF